MTDIEHAKKYAESIRRAISMYNPKAEIIAETACLYGLTYKNKRIADLEAQIEKMKCCENCKYNSYWGNELHCNYGLKEALQEDKLVECKNMDKWVLKEKWQYTSLQH